MDKCLRVFRAKNLIARVAQTWNDVAIFVQMTIQRSGKNRYIGVGIAHDFYAFGCSHQHQSL